MSTRKSDHSMNQMIMFNDDECFYKEYYYASQNSNTLKKFLASVDIAQAIKRHLVIPELLPDIISYNMLDTEYFNENDENNVIILKHNRYTPPFLHKHDFFEIVFVFSGFCDQTIDMERRHFVEGDLIFIAPSTYHTMEVFNDYSIILNVLLRKKTFYQMFNPIIKGHNLLSTFFSEGLYNYQRINYVTFHLGRKNLISYQQNMMNLYKEQLYHDEYSDQILIGMLTTLMAKTMRDDQDTMESSYKEISQKNRSDFDIMSYLQEHFANVTLSEVAQHFGYSTAYCSRLIKSSTGMSFIKWRTLMRIQHAEQMLQHTQLPIEEISVSLGYENVETFIRTFKNEVHTTPSNYRKINQNLK